MSFSWSIGHGYIRNDIRIFIEEKAVVVGTGDAAALIAVCLHLASFLRAISRNCLISEISEGILTVDVCVYVWELFVGDLRFAVVVRTVPAATSFGINFTCESRMWAEILSGGANDAWCGFKSFEKVEVWLCVTVAWWLASLLGDRSFASAYYNITRLQLEHLVMNRWLDSLRVFDNSISWPSLKQEERKLNKYKCARMPTPMDRAMQSRVSIDLANILKNRSWSSCLESVLWYVVEICYMRTWLLTRKGFAGLVVATSLWNMWGGDMFPAEKDPTGGMFQRSHWSDVSKACWPWNSTWDVDGDRTSKMAESSKSRKLLLPVSQWLTCSSVRCYRMAKWPGNNWLSEWRRMWDRVAQNRDTAAFRSFIIHVLS